MIFASFGIQEVDNAVMRDQKSSRTDAASATQSRITHHASRITYHASRITFYPPRITDIFVIYFDLAFTQSHVIIGVTSTRTCPNLPPQGCKR